MSTPVMIGPPPAPSPVRPGPGASRDDSGSDAFSGVLTQAHESQRSDRAVERSHSDEHSQAPEHAHGVEAAKHRSDDDPAPATGGTDPSVVAGGLLVSGGLTPPPPPTPTDAPTTTTPVPGDATPTAILPTAAAPLDATDAIALAAGAVDTQHSAIPATPAVPAHKSAVGPSDADPVPDGSADNPVDRLHRAARATPAVAATPAGRPATAAATTIPAPPAVAPTTPATGGPGGPAVPAIPATPATPAVPSDGGGAATAAVPVSAAHRAGAAPVPTDPTTAASAVASSGFAATLHDVADPAAPRPGKRITVDESPAVAGPPAPSALRVDTAAPVAAAESIRPAQAALPEQPLLLGALSRLRDHGNGVHELSVSLHPAELGAVNVTAIVRDGSITVSLAVVDPAARAAVTSALHGLRHDLAQSGFSGVDVSVADHGRQGHPGESRSYGHTDHGPAARDDRADERPTPRRPVPTDRSLDRLL